MREILLVLDNIRSLHNVGSLLRTADGVGVKTVYTLGVTPTTKQPDDVRLPHVIKRAESQLAKTALGAEKSLDIVHFSDVDKLIKCLKTDGFKIVSIEQSDKSRPLEKTTSRKIAVILGNEVDGVSEELLGVSDTVFEIPMKGEKNSFNVSVAGAIALYELSK